MTGLLFLGCNSLTILSTNIASLLCQWLVKSRIFRQVLRQSCQVMTCLLVAFWSNISLWWCLLGLPWDLYNGYQSSMHTKWSLNIVNIHVLHIPFMILSRVNPCANFSWVSLQTDWSSGRYTWTLPLQVSVCVSASACHFYALPVDW